MDKTKRVSKAHVSNIFGGGRTSSGVMDLIRTDSRKTMSAYFCKRIAMGSSYSLSSLRRPLPSAHATRRQEGSVLSSVARDLLELALELSRIFYTAIRLRQT